MPNPTFSQIYDEATGTTYDIKSITATSLSEAGMPADAKVVGDEFEAVRTHIDNITVPVLLANGTDLDSLTSEGTYATNTGANTDSILHKPDTLYNSSFTLYVRRTMTTTLVGQQIHQIIITTNNATQQIWLRTKITDIASPSWSDWFQVATSDMLENLRTYIRGTGENKYFLNTDITNGYWNDNGEFVPSDKTIANRTPVSFDRPVIINIASGYKFRVMVWDKTTGAFAHAYGYRSQPLTLQHDINGTWNSTTYCYTFNIAKHPSATRITEADYDKLYIVQAETYHALLSRKKRYLDRFYHIQETQRLALQSAVYHNNILWTCGHLNGEAEQNICAWNYASTALINCNRFTGFGHANDIAGVGSQLILATSYLYVAVFDIGTSGTVTHNRNIDVSDYFKTSVYGVGSYNDVVYLLGHHLTDDTLLSIGILDLQTDEVQILCSFTPPINQIAQGLTVYNNFAYILYNRVNALYKIGLDDGKIYAIYSLPSRDSNISTGELEAPLIINDSMFVYGALRYNLSFALDREVAVGQLFETNILSALEAKEVYSFVADLTPIIINVNGSLTPPTTSNPIQNQITVEEACYIVNTHHGGTITLENVTDGIVGLIDGVYSVIGKPESPTNKVTQLMAYNASVIVSGIDIGKVIAYNSRITFIDCNITETETYNSVID